jgi:hypothetical protein
MITNFYEKTTKAFDVYIYINGQPQDISSDVVSIIFKRLKSDTDAEAVLTKQAYECTSDGVAKFTLTPDDTTLPPRNYYYEIKWVNNDKIYILESDTITVLDRIYD